MFYKIFSRKRRFLTLKRSRSVKNLSLKGKITFGYCGGHDLFTYLRLIYLFTSQINLKELVDFYLGINLPDEVWLLTFKKMKFIDLVNICIK